MALKFVIGRSGRGKSSFILDELSKKQEEKLNNNVILMVPEQFTLQAEKSVISKTSGKGIMGIKVLSFHRLAYNVFKETGFPDGVNLTEISHAIALKKVVLENKDKLEYFKKAVDKQGFIDQLTLTISEFFSYMISPEKLMELIESANENVVLKNKLTDLYILYTAYKEFLKLGYIGSEETLDMLYGRIEKSSLIKNSEIYLDGFYGFIPQELKVIEKLLTICKNITVVLTMDEFALNKNNLPMPHVFFETKDTYLKLCEISKTVGVKVETPTILYKNYRFKSEGLEVLEKEFTKAVVSPSEKFSGLQVFSASNIYEESELLALNIIELLKNKDYKYKDIAVLAGNLESYETVLTNVFTECKIPFFMDVKEKIDTQAFAEFIKGVFEINMYNFSFDSVFSTLKTGMTFLSFEDIEVLENYCLAYGIKGYKWKLENWSFGLNKENSEEEYLKLNEIKNLITNALEPIMLLKDKKSSTVLDYSKALYKVLDNFKVMEKMEEMCVKWEEDNKTEKISQLKQCYNIVMDILDNLCKMLGGEKVTLKDYYELLVSGIAVAQLGVIPPNIDSITVGTLERTRLPKIKALFIVGFNDGVIPSNTVIEGILGDEERFLLEEKGVNLAHNNTRLAFEENFLIYNALTCAENELVISYSTGDLSGKALMPSSVLGKIKKIFPNLKIETLNKEKYFLSPAITFHHLGEELQSDKKEMWVSALNYFQKEKEWENKTELLKKGLNISETPHLLSKEMVEKAFGDNIYLSVSRLEKFSACPYSYFLTYTMGAKERQIYKLNPPDLGFLFHNVLENFSYIIERDNKNWKDLSYGEVKEIVNKSVKEEALNLGNEILFSTKAMEYLIKRLERISIRAIWTIVMHLRNGNFKPYGYEMEFGKKGVLPPIAFELKDGSKMILTGKIDRVDILEADGETYVKVIDYKSGNTEFNLQNVYYGLQLQLLLYLDALIKNGSHFPGEKILPAGVFYFKIKDPIISASKNLSKEDIEEIITQNLRMSGLVLNNDRVITGMDNKFDKKSSIIPVEYGKTGLLASSSVADEKTYDLLRKYVVDKSITLGERIKKGDISKTPYSLKKFMPCSYCSFTHLCNADGEEKKEVRKLKSLKPKEVFEKIDNE